VTPSRQGQRRYRIAKNFDEDTISGEPIPGRFGIPSAFRPAGGMSFWTTDGETMAMSMGRRPVMSAVGLARGNAGGVPPGPPLPVRSMVGTGLFLLALLYTVYFAKDFLMPIVIAVLLALVLQPVMRLVGRLRIRRGVAALAIVAGLLGLVGAGGYTLYRPVSIWIEQAPREIWHIEQSLQALKKPVAEMKRAGKAAEKLTAVGKSGDGQETKSVVIKEKDLGAKILESGRQLLISTVIIALLLFYMLAEGRVLTKRLIRVLASGNRRRALVIAQQTERDISRYLSTITAINLVFGLVVGGLAAALGLPNPLVLGGLAAMLNFVPYIGPLAMLSLLAFVGMTIFPGLTMPAIACGGYALLSVAESEFVTPQLLGRRFTLNPISIVLSLVLWGFLWGVPGVLLAIPLLVSFKVVCDHVERLRPVSELLGGRRTRRKPPAMAAAMAAP